MRHEEIAAYLLDVADRVRRYTGDTSQGDWVLRELVRDRGFDGLPQVITKQEIDKYAAAGERELFRGLDSYGIKGKTGEDLAEQFRSGDMYVGTGLFGNGIYVAYGKDKFDAEGYMGIGVEGSMLRMTLKPEAKVTSIQELRLLQKQDLVVRAHPEYLTDLGRYAAFRGYDVIDVGADPNEAEYMVVLNRTVLRVQSKSIKGVD